MTVGITGPSASGKGTIARLLAQRLQWFYIDIGLVFRAAAYVATERSIIHSGELGHILSKKLVYHWDYEKVDVLFDGQSIVNRLHDLVISTAASELAKDQSTMNMLHEFVDSMTMMQPFLIADGRNVGTTLYPDAFPIFCIQASTLARAKRRFQQLLEKDPTVKYEVVLEDLEKRDEKDRTRAFAPYTVPLHSIIINNNEISALECTEKILSYLNR